ncbi:ATP-binding protein [uncultured Tateyamaria sp.]|uniref:ATP/GTP-binding protein n=1 Tax=uncultured Tateyamaria sp. TaxID=455651 RepID=UPI0026384926|nr:ATP-binding protein [uncultured Tateyamaria sp.]
MKLALSGAHGTGKTTLVESVKKTLAATHKIEICREVPRVIGDIADDREFFRRGHNTLLRQCTIFLYQVIEDHMVESSAEVVISDRTMVDHLAYTEVLFPEFKETTEYKVVSRAVGVWLQTYDQVVKVPIEFTVEDDGTREADLAFQRSVDEKIDELYLGFGVKPSSVTGSVSERTDQVVGLIGT